MNLSGFYKDKVLLITGGSMGIGKELARQVLGYGSKVVITGRNESRLINTLAEFKEHSKNILIHAGDVTKFEDNLALINKVITSFGRLDILINNAGSSAYGDLERTDQRVADEIIDTNIKGVLFCTMAAIPELKKSRGFILFISSVAALHGIPSYSLYSLSKMALTGLAQSLNIENKKYGVFVGISYVGFTENETEKKTLRYDGKLENIPVRNKFFTSTRQVTSKVLLQQIANRKFAVVHSPIGKMTCFLSRFLPFVLKLFFTRNYKKQIRESTSD